MLNILKKILKKSSTKSKPASIKHKKNIESYFLEELMNCKYVKKEAHNIVLQHLCNKINLNKTGNKLSADEKRALGINTRLSVTHELIDVLTDTGIAQDDPKSILSSLYYRATFTQSLDEKMDQYQRMGVNFYKVMGAHSNTCEWCKSMNGKRLPIDQCINSLIKNNCTCKSHCFLTIRNF